LRGKNAQNQNVLHNFKSPFALPTRGCNWEFSCAATVGMQRYTFSFDPQALLKLFLLFGCLLDHMKSKLE
jgi:hypothetical protein